MKTEYFQCRVERARKNELGRISKALRQSQSDLIRAMIDALAEVYRRDHGRIMFPLTFQGLKKKRGP